MSGRAFTAHDYVLGELDDAELDEAERLLLDDPGFAAEVDRLRPVVAELERAPLDAWESIAPPPSAAASNAERPRRRRILGLRPAIAGGLAAAAAAIVVAAALVATNGEKGRELTLAAVPGSGSDGSGSAQVGEAGGTATVSLTGLAPSREGEYYEVWLLNDAEDLVSLGSVRVPASGDAEVELPVPLDPSEYAYLDVSVEPDDGDASHSGDSVLRGQISAS